MTRPKNTTIEMTLHDADGVRALSGAYDGTLPTDGVMVLEKITERRFRLHVVETSEAEQSLRSFLTAADSLACEITQAIRKTRERATQKPRRQKVKQ